MCRRRLASESNHVFLTHGGGRKIGERVFRHGGEGLAEMATWLMATSGAVEGDEIQVAIEVPHGPVVETLMEFGFKVHSINPKQMDRFRDRFTLAGAKDDSRDAEVMPPRCAPIRVASGCLLSPTRSSSNCASGRGSPKTSAPSATG
nr:IS110 family transposase [Sinorhizobium medicae]